jgi:tRNA 5-methylaminomethyl-2-thiouridine biosynthesis bifunctional protein
MTGSIAWDQEGMPRSLMFDDKYFCKEFGYEEALYVACAGNRLQERFEALDPSVQGVFVIVETGFGTGLDFCCAWQMWAKHAPPSWKLHFISIELYPLSSVDLDRALSLWPGLAGFSQRLVEKYAPVPGGLLDAEPEAGRVRLTILFDDVVKALSEIKCRALAPAGADAWFLDGFAPSKNPAMWSDAVFEGMARLSRPGTTLSTFTVAGFVRRGLESKGFAVERVLGHGRKKSVLVGHWRG